MDAILPPMIWRSGACVFVEEGSVGLLTPYVNTECNFDAAGCTYQVSVGDPGHEIHLPFWQVGFSLGCCRKAWLTRAGRFSAI